ncbi:MAG: hypothetical protein IPK21_15425 [Haliscomenobacter sp.]|nr:hypothetical protein [Haliscomenobacter sp.]
MVIHQPGDQEREEVSAGAGSGQQFAQRNMGCQTGKAPISAADALLPWRLLSSETHQIPT